MHIFRVGAAGGGPPGGQRVDNVFGAAVSAGPRSACPSVGAEAREIGSSSLVSLDSTRPPPRRLAAAVALLTAGMLLLELIATRIFSALFFYHYTFFAISLVMSGLTFGGLLAARWHVAALSEVEFDRRLAGLATVFSLGTLAALLFVIG